MKKIVIALLLCVSSVSLAAVVPAEKTRLKGPAVERTDARKVKMMVKAPESAPVGMSEDIVKDIKKYRGVASVETVEALENMTQAMKVNPKKLMEGDYDIPSGDVVHDRTKDPIDRLADLDLSTVLGSSEGMVISEEEYAKQYKKARAQIEEIGRQHLGQKQVPVQLKMTDEELAEFIKESDLPEGFDKTVQAIKTAVDSEKKRQEKATKSIPGTKVVK